MHAELQSDCGAHRQLVFTDTRFVPSFLNRRHWDSAWKVKTDFSRSPSSNGDARDEFLVHFYSFLPRLCRCLPFLLKFHPSLVLFPFLHRRVAPLLPNTMLFPLATPTSKTLLRSLNHKLLIESICTANFHAHEIIAHSGHFKN